MTDKGRQSGSGRKLKTDWEGLWAGLPTPYNEDWSVDERSLATNIHRMIKAGVHGIYLQGGGKVSGVNGGILVAAFRPEVAGCLLATRSMRAVQAVSNAVLRPLLSYCYS